MRQSIRNGFGCGLFFIFGVLAIGPALTGCGKKGAGGPQGMPPEVAVIVVQSEDVRITDELPGRVSAFLAAEVRPQVSGIIQQRLFEEGSDVKEGDPLYQIDPAMYEAAHAAAKATLARAEANLSSIQLRADRYKELVAIKAVSQQDYDDITAGLKQARAEIEVAKASLETARINLDYTRIAAPISGRIGKSAVTIGALATAHQGIPFTTIQQLDPVYVDAPQSSASLLRIKDDLANGDLVSDSASQAKVKLLLEDGTLYPLEGTLKFSDVTVDPTTGSFILRMVFPNPDHTLLPGMFVRAVIEEGVNDEAILIPQQAVSRDPKGNPLALIVDASGKAEQRPLKLDRAIGNRWLVSSGLQPGDKVIVEGAMKVRPGAPVKDVPFDGGAKQGTQPANASTPPAASK